MPYTPASPAAPNESPDAGRRFPAGCFEPIRLSRGTDPEAFERAVVAALDLVGQRLQAVSAALAAARAKAGDAGAEGVARAERVERAEALEGLARAGEVVLARIEALEAAKARVEADLLEAYGALHAIESRQLDALPAASGRAGLGRVGLDRVVGEEIALATGIGTGEVARRLGVATAPRRHAAPLAALRAGRCALARVLQLAAETAALSDADVARVAETVLAPARGGGPLPQRTFVTRLRRAVASLDARDAGERRAQAAARRGVSGRVAGDGTGTVTVVTGADAVAAILDGLDAGARTARAGGDLRTLDQLRSDLATDALLRAHLEQSPNGTAATGPATPAAGSGATGATSGPEDETAGHARGRSADTTVGEQADHPAPPSGKPAARVWIVVPFEVAAGLSDTACELPGHGWVTAAHAREIITRPGSVWHTLPVELPTGHALTRPGAGYRPGPALTAHVQALDGHCRGPGCETPAARCDLDHETPYPVGPTEADNLYAKHRFHHNTKTTGAWTSRPVTEGTESTATGLPGRALQWTTLTGRTYTTHPKNWREGLDLPSIGPTAPTDRAGGRSGGTAPPQASSPDGADVPPF